jgi:hypothetical protein
LRDDFDISGGELLIEVLLQKKDDGWTVVQTDEYTLEEYKEWIKAWYDRVITSKECSNEIYEHPV